MIRSELTCRSASVADAQAMKVSPGADSRTSAPISAAARGSGLIRTSVNVEDASAVCCADVAASRLVKWSGTAGLEICASRLELETSPMHRHVKAPHQRNP